MSDPQKKLKQKNHPSHFSFIFAWRLTPTAAPAVPFVALLPRLLPRRPVCCVANATDKTEKQSRQDRKAKKPQNK